MNEQMNEWWMGWGQILFIEEFQIINAEEMGEIEKPPLEYPGNICYSQAPLKNVKISGLNFKDKKDICIA